MPMRLLQSLARGLRALDYLSAQAEPVRLTDLACALGVDKSNANHIAKTLVATGYAEQDSKRRYSTTSKILDAARHQHTLDEILTCKETWRPALEQLVAITGECAHMAVLARSRVWYIDKIDSELPLKVDHPIGSLAPLHCTALGKSFLAFGDAVAEEPLKASTVRSITSSSRLHREIRLTRVRGYAIDDEEFAEGVRCVARGVFDESGAMIAAIGLSGPSVRIDNERIAQFGTLLRNLNDHAFGAVTS